QDPGWCVMTSHRASGTSSFTRSRRSTRPSVGGTLTTAPPTRLAPLTSRPVVIAVPPYRQALGVAPRRAGLMPKRPVAHTAHATRRHLCHREHQSPAPAPVPAFGTSGRIISRATSRPPSRAAPVVTIPSPERPGIQDRLSRPDATACHLLAQSAAPDEQHGHAVTYHRRRFRTMINI